MATQIPIDDVRIIDTLANDTVLCNNWKLFCKTLQFGDAIIHNLEQKMKIHCSITDLVIDILAHWKSINSSKNTNVTTLSKKLSEIGCLKSAEDVATLGGTGNNIWFNVREPTMFYTGRENDLQKIQNQWKNCEEMRRMLFVAITGLGGIGKSELARNYAKQFNEIEKGHCIWIDAETNQTLSQSFQNLAKHHLNLSLKDQSGKEKNVSSLAKEIYEKISNEKCLIIFDNIETYENSVLMMLTDLASKQAPSILKPFVLITSRFRPANEFFGDKCIQLELDVLSKDSAITFFCKSFCVNQDSIADDIHEVIEKLCARLGNFPLALQQAASYIKVNLPDKSNQSNLVKELTKYLEEIEKGAKKLLAHKLPQYKALDDVSKTTYLTWKITLDKIGNLPGIRNTALKLMEIISFLSPDNISIELISKIFEKTERFSDSMKTDFELLKNIFARRFKDAWNGNVKEISACHENRLQSLRDHSMINLSENKTISIHRLVQEVTRIGLSEQSQLTNTLDQLLRAVTELIEKDEIPSDQLIHCQKIWEHATKNKELIEKHQHLPVWIVSKLYDSGKYREVYEFSCQALSTLESTLEEKIRSTLRIKFWKGNALRELGEYTKSLSLLTEVYEEQKEQFGEDDEDCLKTAHHIGGVHWGLENYEEAMKWYENTLEIRVRVIGKEHQDTLQLKNDIALVLVDQGKYKEGMEMYTEILTVMKHVLGMEHRNTLETKHNLAIVTFHQEEFEDALKMFVEVLEGWERVLELDHPHILFTKHWIADTYSFLGRKEEAIQLATEVCEKMMEILGPEHPQTIQSKNNIARELYTQGKWEEAMEMYTEVLEVKERMFGREHPDTLTTKLSLAIVRLEQEEHEDALRIFKDVLAVQEKVLELDHPETLNTKQWIAATYESYGRECGRRGRKYQNTQNN